MKNAELASEWELPITTHFFAYSPERVSNSDLIEGYGNVSDKDSQGELTGEHVRIFRVDTVVLSPTSKISPTPLLNISPK